MAGPVELFGALFRQSGLLLPEDGEAGSFQLGLNGHLELWLGKLFSFGGPWRPIFSLLFQLGQRAA